ncbi:MAG: hypothetical protein ACOY4H_13080 [Thermodesulfobacteriota bacterium]
MTSLNALFFPETSPEPEQLPQLLFFFDTIHHYQASEAPAAAPDPWRHLCPGYPPLPFHEELPRFNQLIRELKGNEGEFYSGQLTAMASRFSDRPDETNVRSLISSLSGLGEPVTTQEDNRKKREKAEELWQARLLLKLAEILRQEERELAQEMAAVAAREQELFAALKGDDEDDEELAIPVAQLHSFPASSIRPELLLKAWAKLFLADPRRAEHRIFVASREENAELLFEMNHSLNGRYPTRLLRLPLPWLDTLPAEEAIARRDAFRGQTAATIAAIADLLAASCRMGLQDDTLQQTARLAADWTRSLAAFHATHPCPDRPAAGGCQPVPHLEMYLCTASANALMARLLRRSPPDAGPEPEYALIAFLSVKSSTCKG